MDNLLMDNLTDQPFDCPLSIDRVILPEFIEKSIHTHVLRLDKIHPVISGNKWFKLKDHLQEAIKRSSPVIITFGGAWSNHIIATACAAQQAGLPAIGFIRGERPALLSDTLQSAADYGMQLEFISREEYKAKDSPTFLEKLSARWPRAYLIPEGGAGPLGIKGSEDILRTVDRSAYSHILCAVGTGTMYRGLANTAIPGQTLIGVPVLKGMNGLSAIGHGFNDPNRMPFTEPRPSSSDKDLVSPAPSPFCRLLPDYHFGGYARSSPELLNFMNRFYRDTGIPSDFVYTGKLFYAVVDSANRNLFPPDSRLLVIHSGGLQGNRSLVPGVLEF